MAANKDINTVEKMRVGKAIYPFLIGIGVVAYMLYREYDPDAFRLIDFTWISLAFLIVALFLMVIRDVGYIIRLKILSDNELTWLQTFRIIMLWEFTSAVTPSAIGGTSLAIIYVNKEGLSLGRSSALVMATSFLDELYFIITFPLLLLIVSPYDLFIIDKGTSSGFTNEFFYFAVIGYSLKFIYTLIVSYGLFVNPRGLKWLLLWIFKLPKLRRWRHNINDTGSDIITSSQVLKRKPFLFWLKAFGATFLSWTSRYWVANALILAFFIVPEQFLIFARQLVMWIMMLVSPTPGGSGFSEFVFTRYLGQFFPVDPVNLGVIAIAMAFLWRLITYYPYLIIGLVIFPRWANKNFGKYLQKRRKIKKKKSGDSS